MANSTVNISLVALVPILQSAGPKFKMQKAHILGTELFKVDSNFKMHPSFFNQVKKNSGFFLPNI